MRRIICVWLLVLLAACASPDRHGGPQPEQDGGIGGTGIVAE